jgi:hypothetical protein
MGKMPNCRMKAIMSHNEENRLILPSLSSVTAACEDRFYIRDLTFAFCKEVLLSVTTEITEPVQKLTAES